MKFNFKFREFMSIPDRSSPEGQAELRKRFQRIMKGAKQNTLGEKRREMAEAFAQMLPPERRKQLEEEISALHTVKDEDRFRTQILLLLCKAFYGGIASVKPEAESKQK